jgi:hypothetical protein
MSLVAYVAIAALVALSLGLALAALILKRARDSTGSWTSEHIAYILLLAIAKNEGKSLGTTKSSEATADRKWVLDTFAECIQAVREPDKRLTGRT